MPESRRIKFEKKKRKTKVLKEIKGTAKGNAGGGNDAGLNDGVLLPREWLPQPSCFAKNFGPSLEEEER